jgi:hypothetical protein
VAVVELWLAVGADWPFVYDTERVMQRGLDIQEYTDPRTIR